MVEMLKYLGQAVLSFLSIFDSFEVIDGVSWLDMMVVFAVIALVCSIFLKTGTSGGGGE